MIRCVVEQVKSRREEVLVEMNGATERALVDAVEIILRPDNPHHRKIVLNYFSGEAARAKATFTQGGYFDIPIELAVI